MTPRISSYCHLGNCVAVSADGHGTGVYVQHSDLSRGPRLWFSHEPWSRPWQDPTPDPPPMDPNPRVVVVASPESRDPRPLRRALWEVWREIGRPVTVVHDPACGWASEWVLEHKPCQLKSEPVRLWSGSVVERVRAVQAIARSRPPLVVASLAGHGFYERLLVDECRRHGVPVRAVEGTVSDA